MIKGLIRTMRRRFRWLLAGVMLLTCGWTLLMQGCAIMSAPMSQQEIRATLGAGVSFASQEQTVNGRTMHWVATGDPQAPAVVFIHGSPGSWDAFAAYLKDIRLRERFHLISVDRLGFGRSGIGNPEPSLSRQAAAVAAVWHDWSPEKRALLVGHSLGGPVAVQVAVDFPERVAGLLLLAPSIDPDLEVVRFYQHLAHWPPFRWMIPLDLKTTNDEILPLKRELQTLDPRWKELRQPVHVIHGTADRLVPVGNANYATRQLPEDQVQLILLEEVDHFIPWTHHQRVVEEIHAMASTESR